MFRFVVANSLRNRLFALAAAAVLVAYGSFMLPRITIDVFPDLNRPSVNVLTEAEGLAPQEVEQLVTFPIETAMNGSVSGSVRPSVLAVRQRANSWTPDGGLDRPVALDRHTAAGTDLGVVIPQRHVLNAAIVPERDGVGAPAKPHLEFRPGAVFE
jgi:AcrB/AcrD/AcrF family